MSPQEFERKLTAILSADVVGYSRLMGEDEELTIRTLSGHREMMSTLIREHKGRVVDSPGDNLLAVFSSVTRAVDCAVEIQREMAERNEELPDDRKMEYRIGVNLGDVIEEGDRIYGDGVNIAARLESLAEPGGICISGFVYNQVKNRLKLEYEFMGEQTVKNIKEPVPVYRVLSFPGAAAHRVIKAKETVEKSWRNTVVLAVVALVVLLGIIAIWNYYPRRPSIEPTSIEPEQTPVVVDVKETPKTIAVLPFVNLSPDSDQEYFVDGLSEELLNCLSKIVGLRVTSRTSSFTFKGSEKTIHEIASVLGVDHILEGSVRKANNSLRITTQLIRAKDDYDLWSETYNRELKDIFAVQEDIANSVADELEVTLGVGKSLKQVGGTDNLEAYELYLVARGQYYKYEYSQALESIEVAITLDPEFALAWAFKSLMIGWVASTMPVDRASLEIDATMMEAALRAIELEPSLGKAYLMLGSIHMGMGKFVEAELAYRKGMELTTESIDYFDYGLILHYWNVGYLRKCHEYFEEMRRKDPLQPWIRATYMLVLGYLDDIKGAEEEYERCKTIFENQWALGDLFITLVRLGAKEVLSINDLPELAWAGPIFTIAREHIESPEEGLAELRQLYSSDGNLTNNDLAYIAIFAAYFGDSEFSMDAWEKTHTSGVTSWNPVMKETRQLPRFKMWAREMGLVDYWKEYGWPDLCHPVGEDDFVCD